MGKITDIRSGAEYENGEELSRAEQRMLAQAKREANREKRKKIRGIVGKILLTLFTLALAFAAILAVVYRDELNLDSFVRMVSYISLEVDEDGQAEEIFYDNDDTNCFAQMDDMLLVCSSSKIELFNQNGKSYIEEYISLDNPAISTEGSYAVVYDLGGSTLYAIAGKQISYSQTVDGTILNARMNSNGYLTLITKETGYKGVITVYDTSFRAVVQVSISSSYVMDALVSDNGKTLAVVTIGADESTFISTVTFYDTESGEVLDPTFSLSGGLAVDLRWQGNDGLLLQMSNGIQYLTPGASAVSGEWENNEGYLRGYAFSSEGYQVMIWSTYETGYQGKMILVDLYGNELAEISISQEVYSVSTAGNYISLLFTNELVIYDYSSELTEYDSLTDTAGARQAFMRDDGSALLLGTESATLFVP